MNKTQLGVIITKHENNSWNNIKQQQTLLNSHNAATSVKNLRFTYFLATYERESFTIY